MHASILFFTGFLLAAITWQDLRSRSVSWLLFPLLAVSGILLAYRETGSWKLLFSYFSMNLGFLILQGLLLKMYFYFRNGKASALINDKIGWGDVLFLLAACCFFSPLNFIFFYVLSLLFSVAVFLAGSHWIRRGSSAVTVPLAGLQAGCLLLFLAANIIIHHPLTDDDWMIHKLTIDDYGKQYGH
jgi:hypothetical protein